MQANRPAYPSHWVRLPKDLQRESLLYLSFDEIVELCKDPNFAWLCRDPSFWSRKLGVPQATLKEGTPREYLEKKYGRFRAITVYTAKRTMRAEGLSYKDAVFLQAILTSDDPDFLRYMIGTLDITNEEVYQLFKRNIKYICRYTRANILCWLASTGVWFGSVNLGGECIAEREDWLQCLERIVEVDWDKIVKNYLISPESLEYLIESGRLRNPRTIKQARRMATVAYQEDWVIPQ